jgi:hypothetical protein
MRCLGGGHGVDDRTNLVGRLVDLAADVEPDERRVAVLGDLIRIAGGQRTLRTSASPETRATTSFTAASNAGVPAVVVRLCIKTFSAAGRLKPSCRIRSIRPD